MHRPQQTCSKAYPFTLYFILIHSFIHPFKFLYILSFILFYHAKDTRKATKHTLPYCTSFIHSFIHSFIQILMIFLILLCKWHKDNDKEHLSMHTVLHPIPPCSWWGRRGAWAIPICLWPQVMLHKPWQMTAKHYTARRLLSAKVPIFFLALSFHFS